MSDEVFYKYVRGKGWVVDHVEDNLRQAAKPANFGMPSCGDEDDWFQRRLEILRTQIYSVSPGLWFLDE